MESVRGRASSGLIALRAGWGSEPPLTLSLLAVVDGRLCRRGRNVVPDPDAATRLRRGEAAKALDPDVGHGRGHEGGPVY